MTEKYVLPSRRRGATPNMSQADKDAVAATISADLNSLKGANKFINLPPNQVVSITPQQKGGIAAFIWRGGNYPQITFSGLFAFDLGPSQGIFDFASSASIEYRSVSSPPVVSDGVDGRVTIFACNDGKIYFINKNSLTPSGTIPLAITFLAQLGF